MIHHELAQCVFAQSVCTVLSTHTQKKLKNPLENEQSKCCNKLEHFFLVHSSHDIISYHLLLVFCLHILFQMKFSLRIESVERFYCFRTVIKQPLAGN